MYCTAALATEISALPVNHIYRLANTTNWVAPAVMHSLRAKRLTNSLPPEDTYYLPLPLQWTNNGVRRDALLKPASCCIVEVYKWALPFWPPPSHAPLTQLYILSSYLIWPIITGAKLCVRSNTLVQSSWDKFLLLTWWLTVLGIGQPVNKGQLLMSEYYSTPG